MNIEVIGGFGDLSPKGLLRRPQFCLGDITNAITTRRPHHAHRPNPHRLHKSDPNRLHRSDAPRHFLRAVRWRCFKPSLQTLLAQKCLLQRRATAVAGRLKSRICSRPRGESMNPSLNLQHRTQTDQ